MLVPMLHRALCDTITYNDRFSCPTSFVPQVSAVSPKTNTTSYSRLGAFTEGPAQVRQRRGARQLPALPLGQWRGSNSQCCCSLAWCMHFSVPRERCLPPLQVVLYDTPGIVDSR